MLVVSNSQPCTRPPPSATSSAAPTSTPGRLATMAQLAKSSPSHHHHTEEQHHQHLAVLEIHDLQGPVLSGFPLKFFATIVERPMLGYPLRHRIMHVSRFHAFRQRALQDTTHTLPLRFPLHLPHPSAPSDPQLAQIDALFHALATAHTNPSRKTPSIHDYYHAYKHRRITPIQVADIILAQIQRLNRPPHALNAVIRVEAQVLRADAIASTKRWETHSPRSVLDGVPFSVKDLLNVADYPTSSASCFVDAPTADADVVRAMRTAGMLMIGKCNMDELGLGTRGYSMHTGQTRNPHNLAYVPGGSSSGGAASVAVGLCPVSIGSDAGGSVRIPAACSGVYGLKPTFARVSTHGRALTSGANSDHLSPCLHIGPLAGSAEDLALAYFAMAAFAPHRPIPGHDEFEPKPHVPPPTLDSGVKGLRVGVCWPWLRAASESGSGAAADVVERLVKAGAVEVPVVVPDLEDIRVSMPIDVLQPMIRSLVARGIYGHNGGVGIGYTARGKLAMGQEFTDDDEKRCGVVRAKAMAHATEMFENIDVLITPALGCDTPPVPSNLVTGVVDVGIESRMMRFTIYGNVTGLPACIFPVTREPSGVPCGVQAMARPWDEETLLRLCLWAQKEYDEDFSPSIAHNPLQEKDDSSIKGEGGGLA